jgi:hypothetical protein
MTELRVGRVKNPLRAEEITSAQASKIHTEIVKKMMYWDSLADAGKITWTQRDEKMKELEAEKNKYKSRI